MRFREDDSDVKSSLKMRSFQETDDIINKLSCKYETELSTVNQDRKIFATGSRPGDLRIFGFTEHQISNII